MTFSHPCALSGRQIVTYIKSPHTKIQLQTFSTTLRKKHYGATNKERFLHGRFWSRARQRDVRTAKPEQKFRMAGCERLWKNFEWSEFSDRKRTKPKRGTLCKQSAPSPSALFTQSSCVEFFLNFMFTNR